MKRNYLTHRALLIVSLLLSSLSYGQLTNSSHYIRSTPPTGTNTGYEFKLLDLREPNGADAFYSYFWWFGDNGFSFDSNPTHSFSVTNQATTVHAFITENYGTGGPPPIFVTTEITPHPATTTTEEVLPGGQSIFMQNFRDPVAEDTMYFIITYKNPMASPTSGEVKFSCDPSATILGAMITEYPSFRPNNEVYDGNHSWTFSNLESNLEQSILIPVKIGENSTGNLSFSAELWLDLEQQNSEESAFKGMRQIEKPDQQFNKDAPEISYGLEEGSEITPSVKYDESGMQLTVANSHDPNKISQASNAHNDCHYGGKSILYTIDFENIGDGATRYVSVVAHLDEDLNINTIRDLIPPRQYHFGYPIIERTLAGPDGPQYGIFYEIDEVNHEFKIEFNGLQLKSPKDPTCKNIQETQGSISFTIDVNDGYVFGPPIESSATIVFDKNDPIHTGIAYTRCQQDSLVNDQTVLPPFSSETNTLFDCWRCWVAIFLAVLLILLFILYLRKRSKKS